MQINQIHYLTKNKERDWFIYNYSKLQIANKFSNYVCSKRFTILRFITYKMNKIIILFFLFYGFIFSQTWE